METETQQLVRAAERGDLASVTALLATGVSPNPPEPEWGALRIAAYRGRTAVVKALLEHGEAAGDVLITAANMGRLGAVRALLAAGADVNVRDAGADGTQDWSALHYAVKPDSSAPLGHIGVVRALVRAGADPNIADAHGRTPLFMVIDGDWPVMAALVRAGANVEARDRDGLTPLLFASLRGCSANVFNLHEHCGADAHATTYDGRTAAAFVAYTAGFNTYQLLQAVLQTGVKPTVADREYLFTTMDDTLQRVGQLFDGATR